MSELIEELQDRMARAAGRRDFVSASRLLTRIRELQAAESANLDKNERRYT